MTSTGVGFLLASKAAIEKRGGACYLSGPTPKVRKVLEIMKALPTTAVFGSIKELDEYLAEIQRQVEEGDA